VSISSLAGKCGKTCNINTKQFPESFQPPSKPETLKINLHESTKLGTLSFCWKVRYRCGNREGTGQSGTVFGGLLGPANLFHRTSSSSWNQSTSSSLLNTAR